MATSAMTHPTATREEWLKERLELLGAEKALTRQSDEVARRRQALPWVKVEKDYRFDTCSSENSLAELFRGRSQLLVYGPDYSAPCPSCSAIADGFNGFWEHLSHHGLMLVAVSRAQFDQIAAHKERAGWTFPWVSSFASDFNYDYCRGSDRSTAGPGVSIQFRGAAADPRWRQGHHPCGNVRRGHAHLSEGAARLSPFALEDGTVYHTYSTYARGLDAIWGMYPWLDRAPLGRNEANGPWWKRRYEYGAL